MAQVNRVPATYLRYWIEFLASNLQALGSGEPVDESTLSQIKARI